MLKKILNSPNATREFPEYLSSQSTKTSNDDKSQETPQNNIRGTKYHRANNTKRNNDDSQAK